MEGLVSLAASLEGFSITFPGLLQGGAIGILLIVILFIFRGNLVAKSTLDKMLEQEKRIGETWKAVADTRLVESQSKEKVLQDALESLRTVDHLIRILRAIAAEGSAGEAVAADKE